MIETVDIPKKDIERALEILEELKQLLSHPNVENRKKQSRK